MVGRGGGGGTSHSSDHSSDQTWREIKCDKLLETIFFLIF